MNSRAAHPPEGPQGRAWLDALPTKVARGVEAALASGATAADAAALAAEGTEPSGDLNASSEYREHLAHVLVRRAIEALGQ